MKGRITKVFEERKFFFVDNDYWCHFEKINFLPSVLDEVEYERLKDKNGKNIAVNVKQIKDLSSVNSSGSSFSFLDYLSLLQDGYFESSNYVKKEFIVEYPKYLAQLFSKDRSMNKSSQIRKYFDYCRKIEAIYKLKKDFNYVRSELPKLIYHINSALTKKLVSKDFCEFIEKNVELAVLNESNFLKGFIYHFEALIGFSNNN